MEFFSTTSQAPSCWIVMMGKDLLQWIENWKRSLALDETYIIDISFHILDGGCTYVTGFSNYQHWSLTCSKNISVLPRLEEIRNALTHMSRVEPIGGGGGAHKYRVGLKILSGWANLHCYEHLSTPAVRRVLEFTRRWRTITGAIPLLNNFHSFG